MSALEELEKIVSLRKASLGQGEDAIELLILKNKDEAAAQERLFINKKLDEILDRTEELL